MFVLSCSSSDSSQDAATELPSLSPTSVVVATATPDLVQLENPTATATAATVAPVAPVASPSVSKTVEIPKYVFSSTSAEATRLYGCAIRETDQSRRLFGTAPAPTSVPDVDGNVDPLTSEPIARYVEGISAITANMLEIARQFDEITQLDPGPMQIASVATDMSKRLSVLCDAVNSLDRPSSEFLASVVVPDVMLAYSKAIGSLSRSIQQPGFMSEDEIGELFTAASVLLDQLNTELILLDLPIETGDETLRFDERPGSAFEVLFANEWTLISKTNSVTLIPPSRDDPTLGRMIVPNDWPGSNAVRIRFVRAAEDSNFEQLVDAYSTIGSSFGTIGEVKTNSSGERPYADVEIDDQSDGWIYTLRIELGEQLVFVIESLCVTESAECESQVRSVVESFRLVS
jgi:hypothetical protein